MSSPTAHATRKARRTNKIFAVLFALAIVAALVGAMFVNPSSRVSAAATPADKLDLNKTAVPDYNINLGKSIVRMPTAAQLQALNNLKANLGDAELTARWDKTTGSVDTIMDFASQPSALEPEAAARDFLQANAGLFGIADMATLKLKRNTPALGGNLLYFEQTYQGLPVAGRGVGVVMDGERRVKAVSGPYQKDVSVSVSPSLDGAAAIAKAQIDLAKFQVKWVAGVADVLNPALDKLTSQLGPLAVPHAQLNIFPTATGARLAYKFLIFSRNPFGAFKYQIDAATGEILYREDIVRYQQQLQPKADVFPTYPCISKKLQDEGIIENGANGAPCGQLRVNLRKFDPQNVVTGVNGTLNGTHAHIENVLAGKLPFAQAALGTWYFAKDDPTNFEARTTDAAHYGPAAEPAEHQGEISQFFYITSLLEYVDYLHVAGDLKHSRVGQGSFPDTYPNQAVPLIGNVHIPNVLAPPTDPSDPAFADKLLGLDNAFSLSASSDEFLGETPGGQNVVVNPTSYGHGYLLNDLAIDFAVPYHEGMHSISSPIAGLENDPNGAPEGSALNEAQADLWAYTAGENPVLGNYILNAKDYRAAVRANGGNPDERGYLRHGDSSLLYSQLGTSGGSAFEEHRDGEIFAAAGWDLRELMIISEPGGSFTRPDLISGEPTKAISRGQENWERILLGAIYVLSTYNPDTMVRARDAMIIADQSLYPSDPSDPDAPGQHRALIEQVFAARELGVNAVAPNAEGRQAISTRVSNVASSVGKLNAPASVTVNPASSTSNQVSWQPVAGAFAYEVLRREIGKENSRQTKPVTGREYMDGDGTTDGFMHINYVRGDQSSYTDNGLIEGVFLPRGLKNAASYEYVVRALNVNSNRQVGVSDNSAPAAMSTAVVDVTNSIQTVNSNVSFAGGKTEFDQTIKNLGAGAFDGTIYQPIDFRIVSISAPNVSVANADNFGSGRGASPASFYYRATLQKNQTSAARRISFNNPNTQLFTFDAVVTARVQVPAGAGTRFEAEPKFEGNFTTSTFSETFSGIVPASDTGLQLADGVTYVDVPFTSKANAVAVKGILTSPLTGVDLDFELRDAAGRVLSSSGTAEATEIVTADILPNTNYIFRVIGWAGVAQDFEIASTQTLRIAQSAGASGSSTSGSTGSTGSTLTTGTATRLVRFTVNPLTKSITMQVLR
ncbi:MAG TPA: M36 family metallopeptidase [Pyrinomonadaceae bacterium]|nr:M36 family metallopeptidase [Pyrinomonadaceae bacterium]